MSAEGLPAQRSGRDVGSVTLDNWQARLSSHFDALAARRRSSGWPLFALEHGLNEAERQSLAEAIREVAGTNMSLDAAPLPWIVYAAEVGYRYSGGEYWYTFKADTPKWPDSQRDRDRVRNAFRLFARRYSGAEPSGAWAGHFGIIAWPITHSILPRDLQRQLAEVLFDARLSFRPETFASAESLGDHLRALSGRASSRFREFAKDSALLGQIALALLLHEDEYSKTGNATASMLIHTPTLERIIADLNAERDARDWLIEARDAARFRIRGLGRIPIRVRERRSDNEAPESGTGDRNDLRRLVSHPRFVLRKGIDGRWYVWVQFPNLSPLLPQIPRIRDTLARAPGRVGTSSGPTLAPGRILSEAWPSVRLADWPTSTLSLLQFDGAPPELQALLEASFRIPSGGDWLFLIGADGQARELSNRVLRPGESYLLLRRQKTERPAGGLVPTDIACVGVYGLRIDVPVNFTETLSDLLAVLGLKLARTLDVWPAGLPIPDWSADGIAEVLAGEPLMVGLRSERRLAEIEIAIDAGVPTRLALVEKEGENCAFVIIPPLPDGRHNIVIAAATPNAGQSSHESNLVTRGPESGLRGSLNLLVRPRRSIGDGGETGAMSFAVHPRAPSLEDLWEDRCELHVAAPNAQFIRCRVALIAKGTSTPTAARHFRLPSPITTTSWREAFRSQAREVMAEAYDEAHACVLGFDAGALGSARITAERDFTPLRWMVRDGGAQVILLDATGDRGTTVSVFDVQTPDIPHTVDPDTAADGLKVPNGGALFCAASASTNVGVVAVPKQRIASLAELGQRLNVQECRKEARDLERLLRISATWERARLGATSITSLRRDSAVNALRARIIGTIAGERWAKADTEIELQRNPKLALDSLRTLVTSKPEEKGIVSVLFRRSDDLARSSPAEREKIFADVVSAFIRSPNVRELTTFAFRLATSSSEAILPFVGEGSVGDLPIVVARTPHLSVGDALKGLLALPVTLRAARLAVILSRTS